MSELLQQIADMLTGALACLLVAAAIYQAVR